MSKEEEKKEIKQIVKIDEDTFKEEGVPVFPEDVIKIIIEPNKEIISE
ncbi:MAG: hypothetical protein K6E97_09255 [Treponema sp.]|nr:hypothetical protein [Treponema sp.]